MDGDIDILIMDEARHRHANEFAAALATLHLVRARMGMDPGLIGEAIARLEAQVALQRLLIEFPRRPHSLGADLARMCHLILRSRSCELPRRINLRAPPSLRSGANARILVLIAYELVNNAVKHSGRDGAGIRVGLRGGRLNYRLTVTNGFQQTDGLSVGSAGLAIAASLAKSVGGSFQSSYWGDMARASVILPISGEVVGSQSDRATGLDRG